MSLNEEQTNLKNDLTNYKQIVENNKKKLTEKDNEKAKIIELNKNEKNELEKVEYYVKTKEKRNFKNYSFKKIASLNDKISTIEKENIKLGKDIEEIKEEKVSYL